MLSARYSKRVDISILCGMLGNMRANIFRDIPHVISTSIRCIRDGWEVKHQPSLRLDGRICVRNLMWSQTVGYEPCTRNVNIRLTVIWMTYFGQV